MKSTTTKLVFLFLFIFPLAVFADSSFEAGYDALTEKDFQTAIKHFKKAAAEDSQNRQTWYYLGISYLRAAGEHLSENRYDEAEKLLLQAKDSLSKGLQKSKEYNRQRNFINSLKEVNNGLETIKLFRNKMKPEKANNYSFVIILGIIILLTVLTIIFLWHFKTKDDHRVYKEHVLNTDLSSSLTSLNEDFKKAREVVTQSDNQNVMVLFEEIEERCIALNDKLVTLQHGLLTLEEDSFKQEIELTKEMINECLEQLGATQKV